MSFILDALKKSETDRQRQSGPALFEVRVAPPRNALPLWAIGLAVLLAVNLLIVAWVLLRRPAAPEQSGAPVAMAPVASPGNVPTPPAMASASPLTPQQAQTLPLAPVATVVSGTAPTPPVAQAAGMPQPAAGAGATPPAQMPSSPPPSSGTPGTDTQSAANRAGMPPVVADAGGTVNPDDYAPAADPPPAAPFPNRVTRNTTSGVPLYQDAALNSHLPNLRLDLHVYAASPQARFVMINMRKLHEGDSLPEGVRVESITPDGAVLSQNGTRFLLPRE